MLCRVDGLHVWADALPPGVSSGCFAAVITYDFTSLLATIGLSSFVLGSVSWGCQVEAPPHVSCFSFVLWTSLVIHGLLANPCIGYFAVLSALLLTSLNEICAAHVPEKKSVMKNFGLGEMLTEFVAKILKSDQIR
jgi:hypothetical protein